MSDPIDPRTPKGVRTAAASGAVLSLGAALIGAAPASAGPPAPFNVTNTNDSGDGSLRDAIDDANNQNGPDTITFQAGLGTITVPTEIVIDEGLTIVGPATLMGDGDNRIFYINTADNVTITALTLTGGDVEGNGGAILSVDANITIQQSTISGNQAREDEQTNYGDGGGIYLDGGDVTITDTVLSGNTAEGGGGGAFFNGDTEGAALSISGSTFDDNQAGTYGGGLAINHLYDVTIDTTTISNNTAENRGGGIYLHTHLEEGDAPYLVITSSTISGNYAGGGGGGLWIDQANFDISHATIVDNEASYGGGLYVTDFDTGVLDHVIVGNNVAAEPEYDVGSDDGEDLIVTTFSLITTPPAEGVIDDVEGNILGEDPGVGILANNGGPNQTHALAATSAALDGGDTAFAAPPSTDQRGESRVEGDAIDIGAYETQPEEPTPPPADPPAALPADEEPDFTG